MLIAVIGPPKAGKHTVVQYLVREHGFQIARVPQHLSSGTTTNGHAHKSDLHFESAEQLLTYATSHWQDRIVTLDVASVQELAHGFAKRPFFLLVAVEAPLTVRFRRNASNFSSSSAVTLEQFVEQDDAILYGHESGRSINDIASAGMTRSGSMTPGVSSMTAPPPTEPNSNASDADVHLGMGSLSLAPSTLPSGLHSLLSQAHVRILNPFTDLARFHDHLDSLDLPSPHRLRPSWETYFLSLCTLASLRSNCMKRRVGAVLVRDNRVLSTGYNGTPRGLLNCNEGGCPRCNASGAACGQGLEECLCLHAEENALLECGRERGGAQGTVLYCNTCPCLRCAVKIVQVGVKEVVYQLDYSVDHRSSDIFAAAGIVCRKYTGAIKNSK